MGTIGYWVGTLLGIGFFTATPAFAVVAVYAALVWRERRLKVFLIAYGAALLSVSFVNGAIMFSGSVSTTTALFSVILVPLFLSALSFVGTRNLVKEKS